MGRALFLLVLLTLPIQLNKFFWPDFAYVLGLPIDYRAPAVYLFDLVAVSFIAIAIFENLKKAKTIARRLKKPAITLTLFNCYLLLSALVSRDPASLYFAARVIEFSGIVLLAPLYFDNQKERSIITFSIVWQSLLLIAQFLHQASLGFWFLGERAFDTSTTAIAHINLFGHQFLRPYGTFPHPNVAAAFLLIYGTFSLPKSTLTRSLQLIAFALTFSKTALVALATNIFVLKKKAIGILIVFLLLLAFAYFGLISDLSLATVAERLQLAQTALDIARENPAFGVGSLNFIPNLATYNLFSIAEVRLLQPVHNLFLLILAENGVVGLILFAAFLFTVTTFINNKLKIALATSLLFFASFDHFLWTLAQGQLLFALSLAYILSSQKTDWTNKIK